MKKLEYRVTFNTPAFLGNAEQKGQWRTPPFKALLRQWWRVAFAAEKGFQPDVAGMRREEGRLFGAAADRTANKSLVRMRLDRWDEGTLKGWDPLPTVEHPEVKFPVDSGLYLAYGPIVLRKGQKRPMLKEGAAIQVTDSATLRFAFPETHADRIGEALALIDRYGAVGGRSRNGWGSFSLTPLNGTPALTGEIPVRHWREALALDWPHAIGEDEKGALVWQTRPFADWKALMRELARVKIGLRTQFVFPADKPPHDKPLDRHWLSYPVTKHSVRGWGIHRLPNSLRFKIRPTPDGKLVGVIFHVPCLPPPEFRPDPSRIAQVWQQVHRYLDKAALQRSTA
jgi:CRISPR-associated protein Cmr1